MNQIYKEERNKAFQAWGALWLLSSFCYGLMVGFPNDELLKGIAALGYIFSFVSQIGFWFLAFRYWAKAKGKSVLYTFFGLLGPFGLLVMYSLQDKGMTPLQTSDPTSYCPHCGSAYKISEYNLNNDHIFCSGCRKELTLNPEHEGSH